MEAILKKILDWLQQRFDKERYVAIGQTVITRNDQPTLIEASSIAFWNQGTTEVIVNQTYRLAPATLDTVTNKFVGGEAFVYSDPTGRNIRSEFTFKFSEDTGTSGYTVFNKLVITTMKHIN